MNALLVRSPAAVLQQTDAAMVEDMADGGRGGIRFLNEEQHFGSVLGAAEYLDEDGVLVTITVNANVDGRLFEIDFWKVDFSRLLRYPESGQSKIVDYNP